jgi:hypothetical protein
MNGMKHQRKAAWVVLSLFFALLTGCQTFHGNLPAHEYEPFKPLAVEKRLMNEVRIRWEVREDVAQVCAKAIHMGKEQAYITPPVACAVWDLPKKECTVITGPKPTHVVLGHEVRHCFEGRFHR